MFLGRFATELIFQNLIVALSENIVSLYNNNNNKIKTKINRGFSNIFQGFHNFFKNLQFLRQICIILSYHKPSLGSRELPQKMLSLIDSAVFTFIGYQERN